MNLVRSLPFALIFILCGTQARAQTDLLSWPEQFFQLASNSADAARFRFSNALFDGGTEVDLFNESFHGHFPTNINIRRDVYNNYDIIHSWTVVDRIRLRVSPVLFSRQSDLHSNEFLADTTHLLSSIGLGLNGSLEITKYQQVVPKGTDTVPDPTTTDPANDDIQESNPYLNANAYDSSLKVKLHHVLQPLELPFELPLSRAAVRRMKIGDVISYTLSGKFPIQLPFSLNAIPGFNNLNFGPRLLFEWHWVGEFQVSVMKESERFVKVRFGRLRGHGQVYGFSVGAGAQNLYNGFYLFKKKPYEIHTGQISLSLDLFKFQHAHEKNVEIDAAFRYDLDNPEGRDAFHQAILGEKKPSERIAEEQVNLPNPSVNQLFKRTATHTNFSNSIGCNLSVIYGSSRARSADDVEATIELPESTRSLLRTSIEERKDKRSIDGNSEGVSHRISILIDEDAFKQKVPNSLLLIAETTIEDSKTGAEEMNAYTQEVEGIMQDPNLFPEFPDSMPSKKHPDKLRKARYGRSSFYFGFSLNEETLAQFLSADPTKLQEAALNNGITINQDLFKEAGDAFKERDSKKLFDLLSQFYADRKHGKELMLTTLSVLTPTSYEKFLVATNPALGNIQKRGHHITAMETDYASTEQEMGLNSDSNRTVGDPAATISSLKTILNSDGLVEIRFTLANAPQFIYFRIDRLNHGQQGRKDGDGEDAKEIDKGKYAIELKLFDRNHRFKEGENVLVLDPNSSDTLIKKLTKNLHSHDFILFTMGYSQKGTNWGYGSSAPPFFMSTLYGKPEKSNSR